MYESDKKCFGVLDIPMDFCDECVIYSKCILAIYERLIMDHGICGVCEFHKSKRGQSICVFGCDDKDDHDDDDEESSRKEPVVLGKERIAQCSDWEDTWVYADDYDEDDYDKDDENQRATLKELKEKEERDTEYRLFLKKMLGPSGEMWKDDDGKAGNSY
jgi:hypothetical protein